MFLWVFLPEGLKKIQDEAFDTEITEIYILDSVEEIGEKAFYSCTKPETASLPKGVKLGEDAFYKNTNIKYR